MRAERRSWQTLQDMFVVPFVHTEGQPWTSSFTDSYKRPKMIGKILSHLIGNVGSDEVSAEGTYEQLTELEEGGWVIVNLPGERLICSI